MQWEHDLACHLAPMCLLCCREEPGDCTHMCHPSAYQYWIYSMVQTLRGLPPDARASAQRHLMRPTRHLTSDKAEPHLSSEGGHRAFSPLQRQSEDQ